MKPFDLKAALAGAPVTTRDGRKVTQLERKFSLVVGVIEGNMHLSGWHLDGTYGGVAGFSQRDIFMADALNDAVEGLVKQILATAAADCRGADCLASEIMDVVRDKVRQNAWGAV